MPGSIYDWSKVAGQNDVADANIDWREGQFPDTVNDSARQMMSRSAEWRDDITGTLTAGGTANSLTLAANSAFTSLANGRMLTFRVVMDNTGPVSLNVNGLGSKAIRAMGAAGDVDLVARDLKSGGLYTIMYSASGNGGAGAWILAGANKAIGGDRIDAFPMGTRMLFQQSTAPTGWTKDTTQDNKALRLVSGSATSGGLVSFTTVFSSARPTTIVTQGGTVGGTALAVAHLPSHAHGPGTLSGSTSTNGNHAHGPGNLTGNTSVNGNHSHAMSNNAAVMTYVGSGGNVGVTEGQVMFGTSIRAAGDHNHSVVVSAGATAGAGDHNHTVALNGGTTAAQGSGQTHTHSFTGDAHSHTIDLAVQYVDVIVCEKAA
ncbi:MAG TPA: hypothetical protein VNS34_04215 [Rhizobiaceae bacterium]|nr:hypothetical protein [Rhizobiaceae bacterium]